MGKGDIKTKRGKIHRGTTGVRRKAKKSNSVIITEKGIKATEEVVKTPKKVAEKSKKPTKKPTSPELFADESKKD